MKISARKQTLGKKKKKKQKQEHIYQGDKYVASNNINRTTETILLQIWSLSCLSQL